MAECRDFFDDSTAGPSRSGALRNDTSPSDLPQGKEDVGSHCLELTLGPSNFSGSSISPPRLQHDMVRAAPAYSFLQRQSSGNFASCLAATSYTSQTPILQTDGSKKVSGGPNEVTAGLGRQRSGDFSGAGEHSLLGTSAFPSRDQIWQTLQKSGTLFEPTQLSNDVSCMWNRRAASMHAVFSRNVVDDLEDCQIRRSCSNGVPRHAVSRQLSNIESSLERSPEQSMVSAQHPRHEDLKDLQKRKVMQAQRRLEARKRRRILTGEKQHKKGRQNSGLLHIGGSTRQSISPTDKYSQGGAPSGQDDTATESHSMSLDVGRSDDSKKGVQDLQRDSKSAGQASSIEDIERLSQDMHLDAGKLNASIHAYDKCRGPAKEKTANFLSNEHDSGSHGNMRSCELEQPGPIGKCSVASSLLVSSNEHECCKPHAVTTMNDHVRMPVSEVEGAKPFSGSETDCVENGGVSADAAKEGVGMRGVTSSSFSSGSVGCPPLLFSPMQYAYAAAGATPNATATQPIFPFPYFIQNPSAGNCENGSTMQSSLTVRGACPAVTNTFMGTFPLSSGAFLSRTTSASKDFVGDSEGKRGSCERSAFSALPRTTSNSKNVFGEPQYSGAHLDLQASLAASQLSSTSTLMSDASNSKNLMLERQPSRPLGGRLLSQNSCIVDQTFLCSRQEKSVPGQSGVPVPFETNTLRLGNSNLKHEDGAKQELEGSSESQLASEHSGVDASYAQSTVIEKQRSGSFIDLPWVTTTGKGPNGKTINGVMYIADGRQVRIICSCHGKHMSPAEFVEHSGSSDLSNPERSIVVSPFPHFNHHLASTPV